MRARAGYVVGLYEFLLDLGENVVGFSCPNEIALENYLMEKYKAEMHDFTVSYQEKEEVVI